MDNVMQYKTELMSMVALVGIIVLAITGDIAGEAAITFVGGLVMRNPVSALKR